LPHGSPNASNLLKISSSPSLTFFIAGSKDFLSSRRCGPTASDMRLDSIIMSRAIRPPRWLPTIQLGWVELGQDLFLIDEVPAGLLHSVKTLLSLAKQIKAALHKFFFRRAKSNFLWPAVSASSKSFLLIAKVTRRAWTFSSILSAFPSREVARSDGGSF